MTFSIVIPPVFGIWKKIRTGGGARPGIAVLRELDIIKTFPGGLINLR
jgi:hypothetical protein